MSTSPKRTKVSNNFTLLEATKSSTALRQGIRNVPDDSEIDKIKLVAEHILQPPREHFGIPFAPSSWFRCLMLNRAIGSKDTSQHVKAEAVDYEIPGLNNLELALWVMENVDYDQLILEHYDKGDPYSGWVHTSYVSSNANRHKVNTWCNGIWSNGLLGVI